MVIFINDTPVRIIEQKNIKKLFGQEYSEIIECPLNEIVFASWNGNVLVRSLDLKVFKAFLRYTKSKALSNLNSVTFIVKSKKEVLKLLAKYFKIIIAAGGVVFNDKNEILFIKRFGIWDLPKGKEEVGETYKETAKREVQEECNIKVKVKEKICSTWHTYITKNNNYVIKKTRWYSMKCLDDSNMTPQKSEGIEEIIWADKKRMDKCLQNTYASIQYVIEKTNSKVLI